MNIAALLNGDNDDGDWEFERGEEDASNAGDKEDERVEGGNETHPATQPLPTAGTIGNAYIDGIIRDSDLHIVRDKEVKAAYKEQGELGLFSLFFTREFRDSLQT
ncbi:hypothetical protein PHMEG_0004524 [Phytophthora megakarya]|uniref:Uncharacterized protein n=1 Tax=Phytophthora megakarya TaxID=4795 RepID=A0A225WTN6_9STRA|nr:hypothetical protein PHMEG_0004524 [Phytophthora megakarya]